MCVCVRVQITSFLLYRDTIVVIASEHPRACRFSHIIAHTIHNRQVKAQRTLIVICTIFLYLFFSALRIHVRIER